MINIPPELESAISQALRTLPAAQWQSAARNLSQRYRAADESRRHPNPSHEADQPQQTRNPKFEIRSQDALGYIGFVLPASYAQLYGALAAVAQRAPDFAPATMLDIASGPGTALWAAVEHFPSLTTMHAYERETAFINLGKTLAQSSPNPAVRSAHWRQLNITGSLPPPDPSIAFTRNAQQAANNTQYDLVIIGHALNEMPPALRDALVLSAWEQCSGLLVIVEPGTSSAFPIVLRARELLISHGAHVIAPCAHSMPCPLPSHSTNHDWCHFPQRLQRPQFQRIAKEASAGWEEAKFTYAALARFPQPNKIRGRLIHQPHETKAGVTLTISANDATIQTPHFPKKHPQHKHSTHLSWGETLPADDDGSVSS